MKPGREALVIGDRYMARAPQKRKSGRRKAGPHKAGPHKADPIAKIRRMARRREGGTGAPAGLDGFVKAYYAHVALDDILQDSPENLLAAAQSLWRFGATRKPGKAKVRVYKPSLQEHDWQSPHSVVEIVNDDMPFLVDSVTAELNTQGLTFHLVVHPIVRVVRDGAHRRRRLLGANGDGGISESYIHVEFDALSSASEMAKIGAAIERVLKDVRVSVTDWLPTRAKLTEILKELETGSVPVDAREVEEAKEFLRWVDDNHFTLLGYREIKLTNGKGAAAGSIVKGTSRGLMRDPKFFPLASNGEMLNLPQEVRQFIRQPRLVQISKAIRKSTVHRPVHLDMICVKKFGPRGGVVGEHRFVGLFTSHAYNLSPLDIPLLRPKVDRTVARAGFSPVSHDGKALLNILESFPRDELFQINEDDLYEISLGILHLHERQRIALFLRRDPFERFISCLVYVPRDRYTMALRLRIQGILEDSFDGMVTAFYTHIADSPLARVHFIVKTTPGKIPDFRTAEIETRLVEAARSWSDELKDVLIEHRGEEGGLELSGYYGQAFGSAYREIFDSKTALADIDKIETVLADGGIAVNLYQRGNGAAEVRFKIYHPGVPLPLSDVLPMLENMGLKVIDEIPHQIETAHNEEGVWIHDFGLEICHGGKVDIDAIKDKFEDAFIRVQSGEIEDDGFNGLVMAAGLGWRETVVLRAYGKYLRQAGIPFSQDYMEQTLLANPRFACMLVEIFSHRFAPGRGNNSRARAHKARARKLKTSFENALDQVDSLDHDRILRRFLNLVLVTQRTNFYQTSDDGGPKPYVSFKLASAEIEELPAPRPMAEIFVYSPAMEGIHLRGGRIARGGIRWSDRREDFRTEILGLMKAQMVKNAVIVPVGAKGGFVVKQPPATGGRQALLEEGISCYKTLIRGMLDLTDNRAGDKITPPRNVVRHDGDDPYLVVAADKGTASFSDIANGLAREYGFWLDDAFASGGSVGFDHKKMGITARGAWESVKRHFRELGHDTQKTDFTVIGVGDMSGDVFGNGMLLSRHIKLVAAFNHLHILIDPDPDAAASFVERKRLFKLPRSSWGDYDKSLISKGGGVFDRKAKSITLTAEMKTLVGLSQDKVTPDALIRAILTAQTDLLWFGGIGTFVKASSERHMDADDRTNDSIRVAARDLRCRVIGEGANLGVTEFGRIEADRNAGCRLNSDAIDNSAGVDTSDHEVNIKILLRGAVDGGSLTMKQRDVLLRKMTKEVAGQVLRDNYLQTQALSIAQARGVELLDAQARLMRGLERSGRLDRAIEFLPNDETLAELAAHNCGLTRPESAILLAYGKLDLYDQLLDSDLPDDAVLLEDLKQYFPAALRTRYAAAIANHPLRRELISTGFVNAMVNCVGPTFVNEIREKTGHGAGAVARAYAAVDGAFAARGVLRDIEALDNKVDAAVQTTMMIEVGRLVEHTTRWFLRNTPQPIDIAKTIARFRPGIEKLTACLADVASPELCDAMTRKSQAYADAGVPRQLAGNMASLDVLISGCEVVSIAGGDTKAVKKVAEFYFALGTKFGFDWLRTTALAMDTKTHWQKQAISAIVDELFMLQGQLTTTVLGAGATMEAWTAAREGAVKRVELILDELRAAGSHDLAMLGVITRELRLLITG